MGFLKAPRAAHPTDVIRDIYVENHFAILPEHYPADSDEWAEVNLVNEPLSLHAHWGSGNLSSKSSCQEQERFCP